MISEVASSNAAGMLADGTGAGSSLLRPVRRDQEIDSTVSHQRDDAGAGSLLRICTPTV